MSLVSALVSRLVLVYVSVSVSAVRECAWWYVFVFVNGGFWQFSLLCTGLPLFAYNFTHLPLYLFNYYCYYYKENSLRYTYN